jgi:hypothetical protein
MPHRQSTIEQFFFFFYARVEMDNNLWRFNNNAAAFWETAQGPNQTMKLTSMFRHFFHGCRIWSRG